MIGLAPLWVSNSALPLVPYTDLIGTPIGPFKEDHPLAILSANGDEFIAYDTSDIFRDNDKCNVELKPLRTFMDVPWLKALTGIPLSEVLFLSEYELHSSECCAAVL